MTRPQLCVLNHSEKSLSSQRKLSAEKIPRHKSTKVCLMKVAALGSGTTCLWAWVSRLQIYKYFINTTQRSMSERARERLEARRTIWEKEREESKECRVVKRWIPRRSDDVTRCVVENCGGGDVDWLILIFIRLILFSSRDSSTWSASIWTAASSPCRSAWRYLTYQNRTTRAPWKRSQR